MQQRILFWDVSKAMAIFLVVWGHSLLNLTPDLNYWLNDGVSQCNIFSFAALLTIVFCYLVIGQIRKSKYARLILLGEK